MPYNDARISAAERDLQTALHKVQQGRAALKRADGSPMYSADEEAERLLDLRKGWSKDLVLQSHLTAASG